MLWNGTLDAVARQQFLAARKSVYRRHQPQQKPVVGFEHRPRPSCPVLEGNVRMSSGVDTISIPMGGKSMEWPPACLQVYDLLPFRPSAVSNEPAESGRLLNRTATIKRGSSYPRCGEYAGLTPFVVVRLIRPGILLSGISS